MLNDLSSLSKMSFYIKDTLNKSRIINKHYQNLIDNYENDFLSFPNIATKMQQMVDRYPNCIIGKVCENSLVDFPASSEPDVCIMTFMHRMAIRVIEYDISKLNGTEYPIYLDSVNMLANAKYGTPQYNIAMKELEEASVIHKEKNRHHPEYFSIDKKTPCVEKMNLLDFTEMILDWTVGTESNGFNFILSSVKDFKQRLNLDDITIEIIQRNIRLIMPPNLLTDDLKSK